MRTCGCAMHSVDRGYRREKFDALREMLERKDPVRIALQGPRLEDLVAHDLCTGSYTTRNEVEGNVPPGITLNR